MTELGRARAATLAVFFANGLGIGAWSTAIPPLKVAFALSDGRLSLILLAFAGGAVSFMPIASADPFGGVIITDWYAPPETPTERFKINIFIMDRQLRADAIRSAVFRQTQTSDGRWVDATVEKKTAGDFENAILTRARQLRVTSANAAAQK